MFHPNNKYKYLCLKWYKTYCDECFGLGKEKNKHLNHDIFKLEEINKYNLKDCIKEYRNVETSFIEYKNFIKNFGKE